MIREWQLLASSRSCKKSSIYELSFPAISAETRCVPTPLKSPYLDVVCESGVDCPISSAIAESSVRTLVEILGLPIFESLLCLCCQSCDSPSLRFFLYRLSEIDVWGILIELGNRRLGHYKSFPWGSVSSHFPFSETQINRMLRRRECMPPNSGRGGSGPGIGR
jgi:hypothetical protein